VASQGVALTGVTVVAMQTVIGFVADRYGLQTSLAVGPAFAALAIVMILAFEPLFHKDMH
jgi:predicted MFS family arabinose efflux permease